MQSKPYIIPKKTNKERIDEANDRREAKERWKSPVDSSLPKTRSDVDKENKAKARYGEGYREGMASERKKERWKEMMKKEGGTVWTKPKSKRNKNYK